jgi:Nif-specific regulatory protein
MAFMVNYDWPGNVRELENAIERAVVLSDSDLVQPDDLPESILEKDPPAGVAAVKYHANVKEFKKQLILNAMGASKGNYTEAARFLGVHPNYLHRLIRNLGLKELITSGRNLRGAENVSDARL